MKINVTQSIEAAAPWELVLTVDGKDYPTRRPTVGLIGRLQTLATVKGNETFALITEIFSDPKPDLSTWDTEAPFAAVTAYTAYFNRESAKNSQAIAEKMLSAMAVQ